MATDETGARHAKTFRLELAVPSSPPGRAALPCMRLTAPDGYRASRSYSVASAPDGTASIELTVERLPEGEVSSFLHDEVVVGDELGSARADRRMVHLARRRAGPPARRRLRRRAADGHAASGPTDGPGRSGAVIVSTPTPRTSTMPTNCPDRRPRSSTPGPLPRAGASSRTAGRGRPDRLDPAATGFVCGDRPVRGRGHHGAGAGGTAGRTGIKVDGFRANWLNDPIG